MARRETGRRWGSKYRPSQGVCEQAYRERSHRCLPSRRRPTFLPTTIVLPSADHDIVKASPPTSNLLTHVLERTSQKRTVPSAEQLASSASRTGLKRTFSTAPEWPRRSVEYRKFGRSGFQMRSVLSAEPVAISWPVGFHARVRMLRCAISTENESWRQH